MLERIEIFIATLLRDLFERGGETRVLVLPRLTWLQTHLDQNHILRANDLNPSLALFGADLSQNESSSLAQPTNRKRQNRQNNLSSVSTITYKYISNRQRLVLLIHIMNEVHSLLVSRSYCTIRELYYRNESICGKSQLKVEQAVTDVCGILQTTAWDLGIFAAGKGYVAGSLIIRMSDGGIIDCSCVMNGATLIPSNFTYIDCLETNAKYVILVEKDTVFRKLLACEIFTLIPDEIILVTGRGYPDVATRWLLHRLWIEKSLPIYMLADADPFGIEIMLIYRHGSLAQANHAGLLACPELMWLGLHPSEIELLHLPNEAMTSHDLFKLCALLRRYYISDGVKEELCVLQRLQVKAKLDNISINSFPLLISDYIMNKMRRRLVI